MGRTDGVNRFARMSVRARILTLRDLCGQWRGDGDKVALIAAIVDRHLAPLPQVTHIAIALSHEQFQGVVTIHQYTW